MWRLLVTALLVLVPVGPADAARVGAAFGGTMPSALNARTRGAAAGAALRGSSSLPALQQLPPADWMTRCCQHLTLREVYLPGSHDSGTNRWTTPTHMPAVLDVALALLFDVVGDLSRTQTLDVYDQLRAGARVLDLRLAVNPWLALQSRAGGTNRAINDSSSLFSLDAARLEGAVNLAAAGGPLTAEELRGALVLSHSLPAAPLADVLTDVQTFLADNPGEVVVLQVVSDTIDVNVAGSQRMTPQAWAAAAGMFRDRLSGVQLLTAAQVQTQTLGQLAAAAPGGGSVLLFSRELHSHGLPAVSSNDKLQIQTSWANGTNSDDVATLTQRLERWLRDWQAAAWQQRREPMLLASAEVTLGASTVLEMVRNRIWGLRQEGRLGQGHAAADALVEQLLQADRGDAGRSAQRQAHGARSSWWQSLLGCLTSSAWQQCHVAQQRQDQLSALSSGATTLYQLGVETNAKMLADVLRNDEVPKAFNVWSMDALSPDLTNWVIALNGPAQPLS